MAPFWINCHTFSSTTFIVIGHYHQSSLIETSSHLSTGIYQKSFEKMPLFTLNNFRTKYSIDCPTKHCYALIVHNRKGSEVEQPVTNFTPNSLLGRMTQDCTVYTCWIARTHIVPFSWIENSCCSACISLHQNTKSNAFKMPSTVSTAKPKSKSTTPKFKLDSIKKPKKQSLKKQKKTAELNEAKKLTKAKKNGVSDSVCIRTRQSSIINRLLVSFNSFWSSNWVVFWLFPISVAECSEAEIKTSLRRKTTEPRHRSR